MTTVRRNLLPGSNLKQDSINTNANTNTNRNPNGNINTNRNPNGNTNTNRYTKWKHKCKDKTK